MTHTVDGLIALVQDALGKVSGTREHFPRFIGAKETLDEIRAYAALAGAVVPPGMKLVPVEPTPEMVQAGLRVYSPHVTPEVEYQNAYRAMLSAAPPLLVEPQEQRDNCEICQGQRGGVPGNENRVDGKIMCDYCHSDHMHAEQPDTDKADLVSPVPSEGATPALPEGEGK